MKKRQILLLVFGVCFILAIIIFGLSNKQGKSSVGMIMQITFSPAEKLAYGLLQSFHHTSLEEQAKNENMILKTKLAKLQLLEQDNKALRDQFQTAMPSSQTLLPATIIGMPSFFPGISFPDELILDKGKKDRIDIGNVVIYKDNLVGIITKINDHFSLVTVVGNKQTSFTAKTAHTNALGVIKGEGNGQMQFNNVVLSENLQVGDLVVTNGNISLEGKGYPAGLIVGQISSIEKNPSALFQNANVQSLIDITHIPIVFVLMGNK